jgi:hypothetical protein
MSMARPVRAPQPHKWGPLKQCSIQSRSRRSSPSPRLSPRQRGQRLPRHRQQPMQMRMHIRSRAPPLLGAPNRRRAGKNQQQQLLRRSPRGIGSSRGRTGEIRGLSRSQRLRARATPRLLQQQGDSRHQEGGRRGPWCSKTRTRMRRRLRRGTGQAAAQQRESTARTPPVIHLPRSSAPSMLQMQVTRSQPRAMTPQKRARHLRKTLRMPSPL